MSDQQTAALDKQLVVRYWGSLDLGGTWALSFSKHRDSTLLEISNYEVVFADLCVRHPDDVQVVHAGHWAVRWIDHLAVRMLEDSSEVTGAAERLYEWAQQLADYPVADDLDLSRREHEAAVDLLPFYIKGEMQERLPDDWREQILARINYVEVGDDFSLRFSHAPDLVAKALNFLIEDGE